MKYSNESVLMKLIILNESLVIFFLIHLSSFFNIFYSKGCGYYCHAGAETATVSLASLWNLRAGVRPRGPMVSQVGSLLVCARKDPKRRIQCTDVNKEPF